MWELLQLHLLHKQLVADCNAGWHSPKINNPVLIVLSLPQNIPLSAQVPFLARFPGGSTAWPGAWGAAHCLGTWPGTGPRSLSGAGRTGQCSLCQQKGNSAVRLCSPVPRAPRHRCPQGAAAGTASSQQWLQHGLPLTTSLLQGKALQLITELCPPAHCSSAGHIIPQGIHSPSHSFCSPDT